ncbi:MAG: nucleotidyltransferase domain-containing protein [Elusimicrobia bacterium]|nr:nucleotidyltransferase domain-containing protein [Elusimicrobiota bacterium]
MNQQGRESVAWDTVARPVRDYVNELLAADGKNIQAVVLYGSAARGEHHPRHSDYNLLLVLHRVTLPDLLALAKPTKVWMKHGNRPPVLWTSADLRAAADVFSIEFFDMRAHYQVLHGEDPLKNLPLNPQHLQYQCESELHGKRLKLLLEYMATEGQPALVLSLMARSLSTFLLLFRSVLRLLGEDPPGQSAAVIDRLGEHVPFNRQVFHEVLKFRQGRQALKGETVQNMMEQYLAGVAHIIAAIQHDKGVGLKEVGQ